MGQEPTVTSDNKLLSRREFVARSGSTIGYGWLSANLPLLLSTSQLACSAEAEGAPFNLLSTQEAELIGDVAALIVPTDETPGAREAGIPRFVDVALDTFAKSSLPIIREGAADVRRTIDRVRPDARLSELGDAEQADIMISIEDTAFFAVVRFLTLAGMLSHPSHGSNKDRIGWQMIDFNDRHVWQYPFGYYDAQLHGSEE